MRSRLNKRALAAATITLLWSYTVTPQSALKGPRGSAQEEFVCHLPGTSERRIGIYRPGGTQRCRVDYTRDGVTRSLWSSGHDYKFCVGKALDIVRLLETVDFQCTPEIRPR
jgi:hypothetical protein